MYQTGLNYIKTLGFRQEVKIKKSNQYQRIPLSITLYARILKTAAWAA